jgi:transcriptional regulator with XRE-family HTH domain
MLPEMAGPHAVTDVDIDSLVRTRLRSLREAQGWTLDTMAERSHLSPSTISRIETGKRSISLDVLVPLARALQIDLDSLLEVGAEDADVVIRPVPARRPGVTTWPLSRSTGGTASFKMRLAPRARRPQPQVHPGRDWFYVLSGRIRLRLGERTLVVETGEAAEFSTMTPHTVDAIDGPAEIITIFDRDGQQAHVHRDVRRG